MGKYMNTLTPSQIGYWIICVQSYEIDGVEISRGRMKKHTSIRPVVSDRWLKATDKEIETMQCHKGKYYNHNLCH
jgi:hypothetical protein